MENERKPWFEILVVDVRFRCCSEGRVELVGEYEGTVAVADQWTMTVQKLRKSVAVDADQ